MALKKSQLYSSLWQSCEELRGGMDASSCLADFLVDELKTRHSARPSERWCFHSDPPDRARYNPGYPWLALTHGG